jgi:hypothetical protein
MSGSDKTARAAWEPLTPRGVAAFARAPLRRLLLVQLIVALLAAGVVVWFLYRCWFPTIGDAIYGMPAEAEIRAGILNWAPPSPTRLAEGRFLAIAVDLNHTGEARSPTHIQIEFGQTNLSVYSVLGRLQSAYPPNGLLPFNRTVLWPWWGAWAPAILAVAAGSVAAGLMVLWAALATLYSLPVWLTGFLIDRECSLGGSWRLAGAALMPGAILMCAALFMYGWGSLDLLSLAVAAGMHLLVGWAYLLLGLLRLPRRVAPMAKSNPFA